MLLKNRAKLIVFASLTALLAVVFWYMRPQEQGTDILSSELPGEIEEKVSARFSAPEAAVEMLAQISEPSDKPWVQMVRSEILESLEPVFAFRNESYLERMKAAGNLSKTLTPEEMKAIRNFLRKPVTLEVGDPLSVNAVKNTLVNSLTSQKQSLPWLADELVEMYGDHANDNVWRDYCIQHINFSYAASTNKKAIRQVLWEATGETDKSIGGTALIALKHLAESHDDFDNEAIARRAQELAEDPSVSPPTRITAIQICAQYGHTDILETVRAFSIDSRSITTQSSALAALGYLGEEKDLEILGRFTSHNDVRLKNASRAAIKRLEQRLITEEVRGPVSSET